MKIKSMIICLAVFLLQGKDVFACDQCGCSVSGSYNGLMAFNTNNFIGLRYAVYHFDVADEVHQLNAGFQSLDLITAFKIKEKWQVLAYLPYKKIHYTSPNAKTNINGIADAGLINTIELFSNAKNLLRKNTQVFSIKGGIEFPTGKFNGDFRADHLPASVATGSESVDLITGLQYKFQNKSFNLFADYSFKHPVLDATDYHYGGQHAVSLVLSDPLVKNKFIINPYYGATAEFLSADKYYTMEMTGTSGAQVFINSGFEFQFNNWSLGINYDIPVYSKFDNDSKSTNTRFAMRLNYGF